MVELMEAHDHSINSDTVIGGFTVIGNKLPTQRPLRRPVCRPSDVCISAPTGSGKTLAYAIPIVQVVLLCGLSSFSKEQADLVDRSGLNASIKADIVITTPGRLVDHLYNTVGFNVERLHFLVIDEADRVITEEKQDWYRHLEGALYRPSFFQRDMQAFELNDRPEPIRSLPVPTIMHQYDTSHDISLQKILVSATLTHDPGPLKRFNLYFPHLLSSESPQHLPPAPSDVHVSAKDKKQSESNIETEKIDTPAEATITESESAVGGVGVFSTPFGLKEHVVSVPISDRALFLLHLIRHKKIDRILCFTNARLTATRLHLLLRNIPGLEAAQLSNEMPGDKRQRILSAFSRGEVKILVCNDSMARGIDIKDVACVVSYEMPPNVKTYVHRIGRTARAGHSGLAYTLLNRNQFFHFKKDVRAVGKTKLKEVSFNGSQMNDLRPDYEAALKCLEDSVKESTRSAFEKSTNVFNAVTKHKRRNGQNDYVKPLEREKDAEKPLKRKNDDVNPLKRKNDDVNPLERENDTAKPLKRENDALSPLKRKNDDVNPLKRKNDDVNHLKRENETDVDMANERKKKLRTN